MDYDEGRIPLLGGLLVLVGVLGIMALSCLDEVKNRTVCYQEDPGAIVQCYDKDESWRPDQ